MAKKSKKTGAKWAIANLRAITAARVSAGEASNLDAAQVEMAIATFKERRKTNRLLAKIARRLKRG
jgi:hypothetical protein